MLEAIESAIKSAGGVKGAYLVKTFRPAGPYDEEAESALKEAEESFAREGYETPLEWMIDRFGNEKGERLWNSAQVFECICADWLCKDCIALDQDEYYEKLRQRRRQEAEDCIRN